MPIRAFWMMFNQIHRLMSESDMRNLSVIAHANAGGDSLKAFRKQLELDVGKVVSGEEKLDMEGWNQLKAMA